MGDLVEAAFTLVVVSKPIKEIAGECEANLTNWMSSSGLRPEGSLAAQSAAKTTYKRMHLHEQQPLPEESVPWHSNPQSANPVRQSPSIFVPIPECLPRKQDGAENQGNEGHGQIEPMNPV